MVPRREIGRRGFARYLLAGGAALAAASRRAALAAIAPPREPRRVFAHYMVCCPMDGHEAAVTAFAAEMRQAQARGIDGFVLNCGNWDAVPLYHAIAGRMFDAAASLGPDFKLLFSADGLEPDVTVAMVSGFYDHPNMYRYAGRPMLSTYGGDAAWGRTVTETLSNAGKPIAFVPFFFPISGGGRFPPAGVAQLIADNPYVDGFFYFGAGGDGAEVAKRSLRIGRAWRRAGKLYMAPVTPYYRGLGPRNYRVFETRGFEGMAAQWEAAIATGAQWVEIVTWNDWGESTYVASFGPPSRTELWDGHWGPLLSHEAYLAASDYYIRWFKTGSRRIERDSLYWFYRLAPRKLPGRSMSDADPSEFPRGAAGLEDKVFVSAFLTASARVLIESGGKRHEFALGAGVHHLRADFARGAQRFEVERGGRRLLAGEGAFPITEDNWANFNYLGGQAVES